MSNNVILTVYCSAFNHEKYISKTLEGFVCQKTDYAFRVLVHDDASTDNTAKIISVFAEKYPDLIIPLFEKENVYSKGISGLTKHRNLIDTKYFTLCEGDDYWTDPLKIQKQISYLESNPDCIACVHNTEMIKENGEATGIFINSMTSDCDFPADDVIRAGGGGLFHTSSLIVRTQYRFNKPQQFSMKRVGDYPLAIYLSTCGRIHYLSDVMSCYRKASVGSWSQRMDKSSQMRREFYKDAICSLKAMNEYTGYKYDRSFKYAIRDFKFSSSGKLGKLLLVLSGGDYLKILKKHYNVKNREKIFLEY